MNRSITFLRWRSAPRIAALAVLALSATPALGQTFTDHLQRAGHILRRTQFGVGPYDLGLLLPPAGTPQTTVINNYFTAQMASNPSVAIDNAEVAGILAAYGSGAGNPGLPPLGASQTFPLPAQPGTWTEAELVEREIGLALFSNYQLREVMAQFWRRHFNTSYSTVRSYFIGQGVPSATASNLAAYFEWLQMDQFRSHALGTFEDLLTSSARGTSMLIYLDGVINGVTSGGMQVENENYARELLELHTLGATQRIDLTAIGLGIIDAPNYSQNDIDQVARAFSGWSLAQAGTGAASTFSFTFNSANHIVGGNTTVAGTTPGRDIFYSIAGSNPNAGAINPNVIGLTIPIDSTNTSEGDAILQFLANNPVTKDYIVRKLYSYFISEDSPPINDPVILAGVNAWGNNGGNICAVLLAMLDTEPRFRNDIGIRWELARTPLQAMGQTVRFMGGRVVAATTTETRGRLSGIRDHLEDVAGQFLMRYPSPEGYPTEVRDQLTTSQYLARVRFNTEIYSAYTYSLPITYPNYTPTDINYDFFGLATNLGLGIVDPFQEASLDIYSRLVANTYGELPIDIISAVTFVNSASTDVTNAVAPTNFFGLLVGGVTANIAEYVDRVHAYEAFVLSWSQNTLQK